MEAIVEQKDKLWQLQLTGTGVETDSIFNLLWLWLGVATNFYRKSLVRRKISMKRKIKSKIKGQYLNT